MVLLDSSSRATIEHGRMIPHAVDMFLCMLVKLYMRCPWTLYIITYRIYSKFFFCVLFDCGDGGYCRGLDHHRPFMIASGLAVVVIVVSLQDNSFRMAWRGFLFYFEMTSIFFSGIGK